MSLNSISGTTALKGLVMIQSGKKVFSNQQTWQELCWIGVDREKQGFISTNKSQELQISDQSQGGKVAHR